MHPDVLKIQARLQQIDGYVAKGLMKLDEANAERMALKRRLLDLALPDEPAPKMPWRARLRAVLAMGVVVAGVTAWLLWGDAGLKPRAVEMLAVAAGKTIATPAVHPLEPQSAARPASAGARPASGPFVALHVELAPPLARRVGADDAVFIELHAPGDAGLPLAALRKRADDLPLDVVIDATQAVGAPERFAAASVLSVQVRVSHTGRGRAEVGDLQSRALQVPQGSEGVRVVIDRVVD